MVRSLVCLAPVKWKFFISFCTEMSPSVKAVEKHKTARVCFFKPTAPQVEK